MAELGENWKTTKSEMFLLDMQQRVSRSGQPRTNYFTNKFTATDKFSVSEQIMIGLLELEQFG